MITKSRMVYNSIHNILFQEQRFCVYFVVYAWVSIIAFSCTSRITKMSLYLIAPIYNETLERYLEVTLGILFTIKLISDIYEIQNPLNELYNIFGGMLITSKGVA